MTDTERGRQTTDNDGQTLRKGDRLRHDRLTVREGDRLQTMTNTEGGRLH